MAGTSEKLPAMPWYPRDFLADGPVALMTLEDEGAYRRLLDYQWLNDAVPSDLQSLAAICKGVSVAKMRALWRKIGPLFHPMPDDPDRLQNDKLERVRAEVLAHREKRSQAGRAGANSRWQSRCDRTASDDAVALRPHSERTANRMANGWPASASAKELPSNNNNGAARAEPAASWPQLHGKLPPTGLYRQQVMAFVASLPEAQAEGWCALLLQTLAGIGTPGGVAVTPDELLTTIATYTASRTGDHDTRYFAGCLRNVVKRRYAETPKASAAEPGTLRLPRLTDPDMQAAS